MKTDTERQDVLATALRVCETGDVAGALEEIPALVEEIRKLREAIRRVAERRRRPDEGHTAWYERLAEMFYRDTGHMAPGKSAPMEMHRDPEEDRREWEEWLAEPYDALVAPLPETGDSDGPAPPLPPIDSDDK